MDVNVVRIGDIAFCTTPFELYMDFMHRVQARSPFVQTFVVQLAGDVGSYYLPTERGRDNKGYSASLFCNMVGPEGGHYCYLFSPYSQWIFDFSSYNGFLNFKALIGYKNICILANLERALAVSNTERCCRV